MLTISSAMRSAQLDATAPMKTPMSKREVPLKKALDAAQSELKAAQERFDHARTELVAERCRALSKALARQGLVKGELITEGSRLYGYDGVEHDRVSRDPAAVRVRLLLVRKGGRIGKPTVPVPRDLDLAELRPVQGEEEIKNIQSKGKLLGQFWTDYPFVELGDTPHQRAPIRRCEPLSRDGDKYAWIRVDGVEVHIKAGYIYTLPGRSGYAPVADAELFPPK